ncbi:MAG TPA: DUF2946 family protein [Rhodopila sp.]
MSNRWFHPYGLFAVLLALMAQLGLGATVPRIDPVAGIGALCHSGDDSSDAPSQTPAHSTDCLICPLCIAWHAQSVPLIPAGAAPLPPSVTVVREAGLPPPSTAPPAPHRPPSQPRAPPTIS